MQRLKEDNVKKYEVAIMPMVWSAIIYPYTGTGEIRILYYAKDNIIYLNL